MSGYRRVTAAAIVLLAALVAVPAAFSIAAVNPVFGYSVDLPVGWQQADNSDAYTIGFMSPNADAMIQILALDPATGANGREVADFMYAQTGAVGDVDSFEYQGRSAALADVQFLTNGLDVRGYLVTINGEQADYALLAFAVLDSYEAAHDHLLSSIDSFAITAESRLFPGPISQYLQPVDSAALAGTPVPSFSPFGGGGGPSGNAGSAGGDLSFLGQRLPFAADPLVDEAAAVLVDREARILAPYGALDREVFEDAWRRYFRMIYRDNYARLAGVAAEVGRILREEGVPRVDIPHELLTWLQGFDYVRTGGLSDFQPPVACLSNQSGDCDSLGLTYVILLHHLDFDAILMASDRYAHALAAVDAEGPGARFAFEGRDWLVAELTADVALGQIASNMADPAGWIGVRLRLAAQ